ncbi:hypothetical protein BGZ76_005876 [Entomortierella beljakovae]|nr:hypothetical protein BGZ76_005876 [Entomortierella beljakovae]
MDVATTDFMFRASLSRPGRYLRLTVSRPSQSPVAHPTFRQRIFQLNPGTPQLSYSTTPTLFRKYESHYDHVNIKNPSQGLGVTAVDDIDQDQLDPNQTHLFDSNEGIETIDPKDFPELYPEDSLEGTSQELHLDNERDFETLSEEDSSTSVLLSDKKRSEEEFSWFVDESFPETESSGSANSSEALSSSDFIPLWQKNAQQTPGTQEPDHHSQTTESSADSVTGLVALLESERAKNVKVIDMREKCDWTDWMIVAEGLSERHLGNAADQVYSALKKSSPKTSPPVMEGRDTTDWIVIDAGSVVIHFMTPDARKERDLEGLWASVKNPLKLKDVEDISWDDVKGKMTKSWKENRGRSKGEDGKRGRRGERDIPLSEVVNW